VGVLADTGGGRLATEHKRHAPCSMFFVFGRWERAGETGEGVGSYRRGQDTHQTRRIAAEIKKTCHEWHIFHVW